MQKASVIFAIPAFFKLIELEIDEPPVMIFPINKLRCGSWPTSRIEESIFNFENFIFTSPLKRAEQTAQMIAKNQKLKKKNIQIWNELKPESKK